MNKTKVFTTELTIEVEEGSEEITRELLRTFLNGRTHNWHGAKMTTRVVTLTQNK